MTYFHNLGIDNLLYWSCYVLGFIAIIVFNGFYGLKYKLKPIKSILFTIISYVLILGWAYILAWVINGFEWGHHNAIRVYIWMPLVLFLIGKLFKIDFKTACDFIAPSTCIVYGIARFGCVFTGCCYGIPVSWGLYSYQAGHNCFPVQPCEALTSLVIAVVIIIKAKKKSYKTDGTLYPFMLILYGSTRFIWEFFADSPKVFYVVTELGAWAFLTLIIGLSWFITVQQYNNRMKKHNKSSKTR